MTIKLYNIGVEKCTPIAENDIPDIIERFRNLEKETERKRTDKSFMVPMEDIMKEYEDGT